MKKKYIVMGLITAIAVVAVGCGEKADVAKPIATVPVMESIVDTTPIETTEEVTDDNMETYNTLGIFKSIEESSSTNGVYELATFTDANGNDFIATISENTTTPEELVVGETYEVIHSQIMTMSLPGIYPQVYSIEESDMGISIDDSNNEYETGYAEADGYISEETEAITETVKKID